MPNHDFTSARGSSSFPLHVEVKPGLWRDCRAYLLVCGVVALGYGLTLAPSLSWAHWGSDGGDFITSAVTGRVPHPPGFPLYLALSRVAVALLPGDPARILNGLSATTAGGAALFAVAATRRRGASEWAAAAAALALAFSPWLWSQALISEVYTTAALLVSLVIWLREWARDGREWHWALVGLCLGLAMSAHMTTVFLLPYVALSARRRWRELLLGLVVGLMPYALLPLSGPWPQPWGDMGTVGGWLEFVSGRMYWGNAFALPPALWPSRLLAWLVLCLRQFTPLGALAVIVGAASRLRPVDSGRASQARSKTRPAFDVGAAAVSLGLVSLYAIGYDAADSWVYLVAYGPLVALFLADGLDALSDRGVPAILGLVIPIALVLFNVGELNLASDTEATLWLAETLARLPDRAVVLTSEDRSTFALWYAVDGARLRPDLVVVDERLWGFPPYTAYLQGRENRDAATPAAFADGRPLCVVDAEGEVSCR